MGGRTSGDSRSGEGEVFHAREKVMGDYIAFWASESTVKKFVSLPHLIWISPCMVTECW